jgi:transcriptional regulator NrdR family protein
MVYVVKRDGRKEKFSKSKIIKTCRRAGASRKIAEKVAEEVERKVYDGITTKEVLNLVLTLLEKNYTSALKYDLKMALLRFGPDGFGFEKFVAKLLEEYGYKTDTNRFVDGKCVTHEIDVLAEKDGETYLIECKFHNIPGIYTGLKEVMYTYARFIDLREGFEGGMNDVNFSRVWLFTNTKFSTDAKKFGECREMKLTGWRHPENFGIENMLEMRNLYPITILKSSKDVLKELTDYNYIFCRDLVRDGVEKVVRKTGLRKNLIKEVVREAEVVLKEG